MARPFCKIKDLDESKKYFRIGVKVVSLWVIQEPPKNGHLEMILMDSEGDQIQVSIKGEEFTVWREKLEQNKTYIMQNMTVLRNELQYKVCNHPFRMFFNGGTTMRPIELPDFPCYEFHFTSFAEIKEKQLRKDLLVDVIGAVEDKVYSGQKMVSFTMKDLNHDEISCTLWDQLAVKFSTYWNQRTVQDTVVVIIRHARIKEPRGKYAMSLSNAWNGTQLIINEDIPEITNFKSSFGPMVGPALSTQGLIQGSQSSSWSQFSEEDKFFYKATAKSIADINAFTCQKDTSFVTIGTTDDFIIGKYGWFYEGCNNCTKRRPDVDNDGPFMCQCKVYNQKSIPRYKLELKVVENCHTTRMIFWDDQCKQLLGVKAAELRKTMVDEGEEDPRAYPEFLDKMLNRRMAIKVKLQPGYATGSVQKVSESEEMLQAVLDKIGPLEAEVIQSIGETSEIPEPNESVHFITQSLSATADHDPEQVDSVTPAKRGSSDDMLGQDLASAQLSSTKMAKRIKTE